MIVWFVLRQYGLLCDRMDNLIKITEEIRQQNTNFNRNELLNILERVTVYLNTREPDTCSTSGTVPVIPTTASEFDQWQSTLSPRYRVTQCIKKDNFFFVEPRRPIPQNFQQIENGYTQPEKQFRKSASNFDQHLRTYLQHPDLDTSDIPSHLQRTLPQYHAGLLPNPTDSYKYQNSPLSFTSVNPSINRNFLRYTTQIVPSTHRPSYSHLFQKNSHNHDPSQTETFLGQITIQSPAELPIEFQNRDITNFQPSLNFPIQRLGNGNNSQNKNNIQGNPVGTNKSKSETVNDALSTKPQTFPNSIVIGSASRNSFLNHRTRIFAPESDQSEKTQVNDYFINNSGEVYITSTENTASSKLAAESILSSNKENNDTSIRSQLGKTESEFGISLENNLKNSLSLESFYDEPSKNKANSKKRNDEQLDSDDTVTPELEHENESDEVEHQTQSMSETQDEILNETVGLENNDLLQQDEKIKSYAERSIGTTTTEEATTLSDTKITDFTTFPPHEEEEEEIEGEEEEYEDDDYVANDSESEHHEDHDDDKSILNKDPVTSVVTTRSFINNTIIGTVTPDPTDIMDISSEALSPTESSNPTTKDVYLKDQVLSPIKSDDEGNSTDGWVVVASVQTSRSVSGARYLPLPIVEQHEQTKSLNEPLRPVQESSEESSVNNATDAISSTTTIVYEDDITTMSSTDKQNSSTESLIDKLDRVQSDLSSGLLTGGFNGGTNNIALITEGLIDRIDETTMYTPPSKPSAPTPPAVVIRKFSPNLRPSTTGRSKPISKSRYQTRKMNVPVSVELPQSDQPVKLLVPNIKPRNGTTGRSSGISNKNQVIVQDVNPRKPTELAQTDIENFLKKIKFQDTSAFLPRDYTTTSTTLKPTSSTSQQSSAENLDLPESSSAKSISSNKEKDDASKQTKKFNLPDDISAFLPPGYKIPSDNDDNDESNLNETKTDTTKYKDKFDGATLKSTPKPKIIEKLFENAAPIDISVLLPPGYKLNNSPKQNTPTAVNDKAKPKDINSPLLPTYKEDKNASAKLKNKTNVVVKSEEDDVSAFLPPGYRSHKKSSTTARAPTTVEKLHITPDDVSAFLPAGYRLHKKPSSTTKASTTTEEEQTSASSENPVSSTTGSSFKVVFPSRPGGFKKITRTTTTTSKPLNEKISNVNTPLSILKGWPSRATTEFTGWPTPSTTPISIEKLLEAARAAATSSSTSTSTTSTTTISTTTTTTTTHKPTTPGMCKSECDLAGTIKLTGGAKWVPELLDRNTKEYQILANEVQYLLEDVYSNSDELKRWYKKIRIDGFSEGSVLVDYWVELNNVTREVNTRELKSLFHQALESALKSSSNREAKASDLNEEQNIENKLTLGNFVVDPMYTDFVVLPKGLSPTVGYAEENVLLPQWAIAIIVIGLASLLFVIIFGVTVLVNKQKNAKKKQPSALTEDMLNELDKNHMGGLDNYGADDLYNMEDVWNDKPYDVKPTKKRSMGSLHDNSMPNIYDSWKSEWNGYYYNTYYGNHPGSSHAGYGRRRSDYDTNF